jgi:hypothetical protein
VVSKGEVEKLQQAAAELLDDVQTDDEFIAYLETEVRALLDEIYAELGQAPAETTGSPQSTDDNPEADPPATSDVSRSG